MGKRSAAPIAQRRKTRLAGVSSATAILMNRYGMPQMKLMAAKRIQPRRVTVPRYRGETDVARATECLSVSRAPPPFQAAEGRGCAHHPGDPVEHGALVDGEGRCGDIALHVRPTMQLDRANRCDVPGYLAAHDGRSAVDVRGDFGVFADDE